MERTASSRYIVMQQAEEGVESSAPRMRSLSASAFKTIMCSTKITFSTSTASFRESKTGPATSTTTISNLMNSSFHGNNESSGTKAKKRCIISFGGSSLSASTLQSFAASEELKQVSTSGTKQTVDSSINCLPSCGSLTSSSSLGSVQSFKQLIQTLSSSSSGVGISNIQRIKGSSSSNGGVIPFMFQRNGKSNRTKSSGNISRTMNLKLRRELQRTTTKIGFQECSSPRLFNAAV